MLYVSQLVTTLTCGLFAGAAIYITFVEHPARMLCSTEVAATVWAPSYQRATVMQASLAAVSFIGGVCAWLIGGGLYWLIGAVVIFSVIPFTLFIIRPTNERLLAPDRNLASSETRSLLEHWGKLHFVRSFLSVVAFIFFLAALS